MKFNEFSVITENIREEIASIASANGISESEVDFTVVFVKTYFRFSENDPWELMEGDFSSNFGEEEVRNSRFEVRQEYGVTFRKRVPNRYFDIPITINVNKDHTLAIAVFRPEFDIPLKKGVQEYIQEQILKKMIMRGILLEIWSERLEKEIRRFLAKIQKEGRIQINYALPIAKSLSIIPSANDRIILHYNKNRTDEFIDGVGDNELLFEYIQPIEGRYGRDLYGSLLLYEPPIVKYAKLKTNPLKIREEKDEGRIRFYSIGSGYVTREKLYFDIKNELEVNSLKKRDGHVLPGEEKDVNLIIKEANHHNDAIGVGMEVEVQRLHVAGIVANNTKITAGSVNIDAQTHKTSIIQAAEHAKIQLHRGTLKAPVAEISVLEAGFVEADEVKVETMVGGKIIAKIARIGTMCSNATVIASELIEVKNFAGENNFLSIAPGKVPSFNGFFTEISNRLEAEKIALAPKQREFLQRQSITKNKISIAMSVQKRIALAKEKGISPSYNDLNFMKRLQEEVRDLKRTQAYIEALDGSVRDLEMKLKEISSKENGSLIICGSSLDGSHRISFESLRTGGAINVYPVASPSIFRTRIESSDGIEKIVLIAESLGI